MIRTTLAVLLMLSVSGCSTAQPTHADQSVVQQGSPLELHGALNLQTLAATADEDAFATLERLQFSRDGEHLMLLVSWQEGREIRSRLAIYQTDSLSLVHSQLLHETFDGRRTGYLSGWLDPDRYFVYAAAPLPARGSESDGGTKDGLGQLRVFEPGSGAELKRYYGNFGSPFSNDYLLLGPETLRWETGETFHTSLPTTAFSDFTRSGWALFGERDHGIHRVHPQSGAHEHWRSDMRWPWPLASASERHVVAIGEGGACRVWRLPEKKPSGDCSQSPADGQSVLSPGRLATHPLDDRFAVAHGNRVYVYELEPFLLAFEAVLSEPARYLVFTPGRELLIGTESKLQVWDPKTGEQIAFAERASHSEFLTSTAYGNGLQRVSPDGRFAVLERAVRDGQDIVQPEVLIYRLP